MTKQVLVPGHTLRDEGAAWEAGFRRVRVGRGRCSCGVLSPVLKSDTARKRWHRDHKDEVLAAAGRLPGRALSAEEEK